VVLPTGAPAGRDETEPVLRPRLEAMVMAVERVATRPAAAPRLPAGTERGDLVRFTAPGGPRLVVLRDTSAPLVTLSAAWAGGAASETPAQSGRAAAIAALLDAGTRKRTAADIAAELRAGGGTLQGFSTATALGLRAEVLPAALDSGLALFADCLLHSSFPEPELEAQRRALFERARSETQGPGAAARAALRAFSETLWPRQPFHFEASGGTPEAIAALTRVRLLDHYHRRYPLSRLAVAVVGDVDPARVAAALAPLFAPEAAPDRAADGRVADAAPTGEPAVSAPAAVAATTLFRTAPGADEAYAVIGYPGLPGGDPDRVALEILAEVLSSRDAVAASPGEPGYFAVRLAASPAHLDEAVQEARGALARVAADGVTADEIARAARHLIGRHAARLRSKSAIADALALDEAFDLDPLAYREYPGAVARVRPADVARAARRVLDPSHEVITVVRPADAVAEGKR
jgi:zinc protease